MDETYQILLGLRERYEAHHKLRYTDEALDAAAKYSHQYISDRWEPHLFSCSVGLASMRMLHALHLCCQCCLQPFLCLSRCNGSAELCGIPKVLELPVAFLFAGFLWPRSMTATPVHAGSCPTRPST